jgi:hypothetical protein
MTACMTNRAPWSCCCHCLHTAAASHCCCQPLLGALQGQGLCYTCLQDSASPGGRWWHNPVVQNREGARLAIHALLPSRSSAGPQCILLLACHLQMPRATTTWPALPQMHREPCLRRVRLGRWGTLYLFQCPGPVSGLGLAQEWLLARECQELGIGLALCVQGRPLRNPLTHI